MRPGKAEGRLRPASQETCRRRNASPCPRVEGEKGDQRTASTKPTGAAAEFTASRAIPIFMAALFGIFIIGGVGFSHIEAVHNAAHDYRHSMGFPCH